MKQNGAVDKCLFITRPIGFAVVSLHCNHLLVQKSQLYSNIRLEPTVIRLVRLSRLI